MTKKHFIGYIKGENGPNGGMLTTEEIIERLARDFMKPSFTRAMDWVEIDGTDGITFIPSEDVSLPKQGRGRVYAEKWYVFLKPYYSGRIWEASATHGYGARLSAPGYMDATEWQVFPTLAEAQDYIADTYGDCLMDAE